MSDETPDRADAPDGFAPVHGHSPRPYDWVGGQIARRARLSPDAVGLRDTTTDTPLTYAALDRRADRAAALLADRGIGPGDRVAVVSRNRPEVVDLFFGASRRGAVLAPLSHRLAPPETAELLADVAPDLAVVEAPFVDDLKTALDRLEESPPTLVLGTGGIAGTDGPAPETTDGDALDGRYAAALADHPETADPPRADVSLADPALFLHTGGSTGTPKETVLTHGALLWNAFNTITAWGLRPDDVTPMTFPTFHTGGWNVLTLPLFQVGGEVAIAREFDPADVLRSVERLGATVLVAVPAVLRTMVDHPDWTATDLSTLRFVKSGGGPCRERVLSAWWDRDVDVSQGYGLTECGPNNFAMPEDWDRSKADGVGVPAPYVSTRVVDDDGDPVPTGEVGELELASPAAGDRYWRAPDETAAAFGSGWVSTGDLARVDDAGYHYIEGRVKNMYVSGGENVYPAEVEDAVADHPAVEEVVVVGVPDEQWGQVGHAVVVGDDSLDLDTLRDFLDGRLARFKHPRKLSFVAEMPTSGPDKIDRAAIEARFGAGE